MFQKFLNSLKTPNNASLIEAIQKGFLALIESDDEYAPKSGIFFIVPEIGKIQSMEEDTHLLPRPMMLHYDYFLNYILPYYFDLSETEIKRINNARSDSWGFPFRRGKVIVEPNGETDPDRIKKVYIEFDGGNMTSKNKEELISYFNLQDVRDKLYFSDYEKASIKSREEFNNILIERKENKPITKNVDYKQFKPLPALSTFESK